jgi:type IV pilus assembly protein PilY1
MSNTTLHWPHFSRLAASFACAGALLGNVAAHATTDISTRPLKADLLVKPNVIFGLDDSGSMDWEILLTSNSGVLWWDNNNPGTAWQTGGAPRNSGGTNYNYLFPNTANPSATAVAPAANIYADNAGNGRAVPPSAQFAMMRSSAFNPLYYNPAITYAPWVPAHHGGSLRTYPNASPTAASRLPYVAGASTLDLTVNQTANFVFRVGMRRPDNVVGTTNVTLAASYFPATYWAVEDCGTAANWNAANYADNCVVAPDGRKLKRVEIKPANYATTAAYEAAIQNFANWFTYYRKRRLMLAGSMGQVMEDLDGIGLRMGVVIMNERAPVTMFDADSTDPAANRLRVAGLFYTNPVGTDGTPSRVLLDYIGNQYRTNNSVIQSSCQRNSAFIVTDGFTNGASPVPPAYTPRADTTGYPFTPITANSIADVATSYYTINLRNGRTGLSDGRVPKGNPAALNPDNNTDLHMNTYAITLGARGAIWPAVTNPWATTVTWNTPADDDPRSIDDLWRATINSRGQMYVADSPEETARRVREGLEDIIGQVGAQSAVSVSSVNLRRGDAQAYLGNFNPRGWGGDVTANALNKGSGEVSNAATWSAAVKLHQRSFSSRVIVTHNGSSAVSFSAGAVGSTVNPSGVWGDTSKLIDYLRGDGTHETWTTAGPNFRKRPVYDIPLASGTVNGVRMLMGAVMNARPAVAAEQRVVFAPSSEGMLHALDASTGDELWAYVPSPALPLMGAMSDRSWVFETALDGSPTLGRITGNKTLLIGGMGAAGKGFYAIDVSAPRGLTEASLASKVLWEFTPSSSGGSTMGLSMGKPLIVKSKNWGDVVLLTQGYNGSDNRGRIYVLDALTGALRATYVTDPTADGNDAGLAQLAPMVGDDGYVRHIWGGDLKGRLWRFDIETTDTSKQVNLVATLTVSSGKAQPITSAPDVTVYSGHTIVVVGTGRFLGLSDFGKTDVQSFYAIKDDYGATITSVRTTLVQRTLGAEDAQKRRSLSAGSAIDWNTGRGWYFDLPAGQMANTDPTLTFGAAVFSTNQADLARCDSASYIYAVCVIQGGDCPGVGYAGKYVSGQTISSITVLGTDGSVAGVKTVGVGQTSDGRRVVENLNLSPTITPRKNSWRQVRRE